MPVCLEPNQRFPICLDSDMDKPAATRPTFYVRGIAMREQLRLGDEIDATYDFETNDQIFAATCELASKFVVGWKNMGPHEYPCDLRDFLIHREATELLRKIMYGSYVSPEEKKSFELPHSLGRESCASHAATASVSTQELQTSQ